MDTVIKENYEISVWRDIYEMRAGETEATWHEDKIAIIGSNTRTDAARAFNPVLTVDIYGQETFKFDIYSKYYDEDGTQVENPYLNLLINEAKVKVKFRGKWHDFIIKEVGEVHGSNFVVSYSCQSLAIYELGKSGYEIDFSEGQNNNVQTASEFMRTALDGSGWKFSRGNANLLEEDLEQAFQISLVNDIQGKKVEYILENGEYTKKETNTTFSKDGLIFFPYSEISRTSGYARGVYVSDKFDIQFDSWNNKITNGVYCEVEAKYANGAAVTKYKVVKVVENKKQEYNNYLQRYVDVYTKSGTDVKYYGYETYITLPYAIVYQKSSNSLGVCLMNIPARAAVFDFKLNGEVKQAKSHTAAFVFEGLNANTSYELTIQPFGSSNEPLDIYGNIITDGTQGQSYKITSKTLASGEPEWIITDDTVQNLETNETNNFATLYFKENDETNPVSSLPSGYIVNQTYEKCRTIEVSQSNRFNITQQIAETFEVWCRYEIQHDDKGAIISKTVTLTDNYGQENNIGFRYGVNLSKIARTVKSDELVTKLYVPEIENSAAADGYCSISEAKLNPSGENFLIDFSYFINKGMLDEEALYLDIYGAESGYYTVLKKLNEEYTSIIKTQLGYGDNSLTNKKLKLVSDIQVEQARIYAATESIENIENGSGAGSKSEYEDIIKEANLNIKSKQSELAVVDKQLADCQKAIKDNVSKRKNLNDSFYTKYSRYIQEGTWTGDNYIEPNTYFFDAQKVITRNSRPQIEYNLDVVDVSVLIDPETQWDYSPYAFEVGDISSIIDTQYFGYDENGAPRAEKVVVSEVSYNLDSPEKNSIQIQNYSTQFEDLFSRLNASIQSLTLNQNTYAKAENFTGTGALTYESLQQSFDRNKALSESSANGTYTQENGVITLKTDGYDESTKEYIKDKYQVKLLGGGIILSSDGGATWKTGIYGGEINTSLLKAGQIDAERINIMMGNHPAFEWDSKGISAYWHQVDETGKTISINNGKYVRFDDKGLYGIIEDGKTPDINNANFALTWDGLRINLPYKKEDGKKLVIGVNADAEKGEDGIAHRFLVYNDGSMEATSGTFNGTVKAAKFEGMSSGKLIGPELMVGLIPGRNETSEDGNDYNFWVDSNGNVKLSGKISWFDSDLGNYSADLSTNNLVFKLNLLGVYIPSSSSVSFSAARGTNDLSFVSSNPDVEEYTITYSSTGCSCSRSGESLIISPNSSNGMVTINFIFNNGKTITKYISVSVVEDGEQGEQGPRGQDFSGYDWIKSTEITVDGIRTPTLDANVVAVGGHFSVGTIKNNTMTATGYMGYATGSGTTYDEDGNVIMTLTEGVGISTTTGRITDSTTSPYLIVTDAGARMSAGGSGLLVTSNGAYFKKSGGSWQEIGSGTGVAVFG